MSASSILFVTRNDSFFEGIDSFWGIQKLHKQLNFNFNCSKAILILFLLGSSDKKKLQIYFILVRDNELLVLHGILFIN